MLLKTAASLALTLALGACATTEPPGRTAEALTPTEHFKATAVLAEDAIRLRVHAQGLSPNQAAALAEYVDGWREAQGGLITLSAPAGGAEEAAVYQATEAARRVLIGRGVPPHLVLVSGYDAQGDVAAPLKVGYERYQAVVPRCGQTWVNLSRSAANEVQPNFGCAVTANMAAQIANPADLVAPAALGPADAQRRQEVLTKYRKGEVTSSAEDKQARGVVSKVVQ